MKQMQGGDEGRPRRAAGALEAEILAALWAADVALTPREVLDHLGDESLAYNTVHTILARLFDKGMVSRVASGRAHRYAATALAQERAAEQMAALLDHGPDRHAVLQRFVTALSPADERALRSLLRRAR